jgi:hypothetical protein
MADTNKAEGWGLGTGLLVAFLIAGAIARSCSNAPTKPVAAVPPPLPPGQVAPFKQQPPPQFDARVPVARLNVSGRDGTGELQQIVAGMTEQEAILLGLGVFRFPAKFADLVDLGLTR